MVWPSSEVIDVLVFLLPGFVAASIFYSLTSHPKPGAFDRVIQALVFTVIAQVIAQVTVTAISIVANVTWKEDLIPVISVLIPVISVLIAVVLALVTVYWSNNDSIHRILRRFNVTKETSYPSQWYSTFWRLGGCYVVLHMKGERRLYGWPEEWPSQPDRGHFRISEGEWLTDNNKNDGRSASEISSAILIPAIDVEMVEFVEGDLEKSKE